MGDVLSWGWNVLAGGLVMLCMGAAWLSALGAAFAVVGVVRRRCGWGEIAVNLLLCALFSGLFHLVFRVSYWVSRPSPAGGVLFWVSFLACGAWCLRGWRRRLGDAWESTNHADPREAVPECASR